MHIELKDIEVPIKGLKEKIHIVQITDIHIGPVREQKFVQKMVITCNQQNPDMIFITGDLFDGSSQIHDEIIETLKKFNAPVFMVTGNHDYFQGTDEVYHALKRTQIRLLRNQKINFNDLQIIGVDYSFQSGHLERSLQKIDFEKDQPSVLLYHLPRELEAAHNAGVNLQLSGHTHNGQIFPFKYLVKLQFPYIGGLYQYKDTKLYVSQGTGTWGPPMRLGSRCEVTNLYLNPIKPVKN
jgi:predicted MPP superfamily phosphohydrolase